MLKECFFSKKSKGEVLLHLHNLNCGFNIPKTVLIEVQNWKKDSEKEYLKIKKNFISKVAIRSSSRNEDNQNKSNAGKYLSILNVDLKKKKLFFNYINQVILSYGSAVRSNDQIIIQQMVGSVYSSGVIFTKDLETGANYYVVNYDDVTGKTTTVTSGHGNYSNRILYIHKDGIKGIKSERFRKLINLTKKLEKKIGLDSLDIEFVIKKNMEIFLLQVRPISTTQKWKKTNNKEINLKINFFEKKLKKFFNKKKIDSTKTILGNMPDWNPVEILGKFPSPLAVSIYKYLITDNIWAKARLMMGYKDLTRYHLMQIICGQPYINTRLSLNSFLPNDLNNNISKKIVDHGINFLKKNPHYHDKIEFEISEPSFSFSSKEKIQKLFNKVLKKNEKKIFFEKILNHTKRIIQEKGKYSIAYCSKKIENLNSKYEKNDKKNLNDISKLIKKCRDIGTLNFSILARHAFIAKSFINSLIKKKIFNPTEIDLFEQNLNSITTQMLKDTTLVSKKLLSKFKFMEKYGHLRPGTYDITSKRYDQMKNIKFFKIPKKNKKFRLSKNQIKKINALLKKNKFKINAKEFIDYLKQSLILREYSKFIFTKYLSLILEKIAKIGKKNKLTRKDLSYLDINFFIKKKKIENKNQNLENYINKKKIESEVFNKIKLPALILDETNLRVVPYQVSMPNFITKKKIDGNYINLDKITNFNNLNNKIVLIENADPGYDWIFSHKIKGLVTKFGGINSHMAIRCSELSIPAVIGCGEQIYSSLSNSLNKHIFIDCLSSLIYSSRSK